MIEDGSERISFINQFNLKTDITLIAESITKTLGLSLSQRYEVRNWEEYLKLLMDKSEAVGIWVMRNGRVGYNSHRTLDVEEFRGFTLCDDYAPVVFLNGADATAAQIFTLIHELAHLWLGESGVSDLSVVTQSSAVNNQVEKKCNIVAAEVLVPKAILREHWNKNVNINSNTDSLSKFFRVSPIVIARRAFDLHFITQGGFSEFYGKQVELWRRLKSNKAGGGSFYRTLPIANGQRFTETVLQSVYSQRTLMRDGARLLGTNTGSLEKLAQRKGLSSQR